MCYYYRNLEGPAAGMKVVVEYDGRVVPQAPKICEPMMAQFYLGQVHQHFQLEVRVRTAKHPNTYNCNITRGISPGICLKSHGLQGA